MAVYFIQAGVGGPIKIGYSREKYTVEARLKSLQTANPCKLRLTHVEMDGDQDREAQLHERFAQHRMEGEWFAPAEAVRIAARASRGDLLDAARDAGLSVPDPGRMANESGEFKRGAWWMFDALLNVAYHDDQRTIRALRGLIPPDVAVAA